jgi:hypothetical protein
MSGLLTRPKEGGAKPVSTGSLMAKKRVKPGPKPAPPGEQRDEIVAVRCRSDWKDWLQAFAERERSTPTTLIDQALADLAAKRAFRGPPKR